MKVLRLLALIVLLSPARLAAQQAPAEPPVRRTVPWLGVSVGLGLSGEHRQGVATYLVGAGLPVKPSVALGGGVFHSDRKTLYAAEARLRDGRSPLFLQVGAGYVKGLDDCTTEVVLDGPWETTCGRHGAVGFLLGAGLHIKPHWPVQVTYVRMGLGTPASQVAVTMGFSL